MISWIKKKIGYAYGYKWQWARKLHGGIWESWHVDYPFSSVFWHRIDMNERHMRILLYRRNLLKSDHMNKGIGELGEGIRYGIVDLLNPDFPSPNGLCRGIPEIENYCGCRLCI